jgi:D-amino-acid dehydrogenase
MSDVVVIGAGLIGLGVAFELSLRGARVTLVDRGRPGGAASAGNTGWIVPSLSGPIPAPGVVRSSLGWMLGSDAPLRIPPRIMPGLVPWLLSFLSYCNRRDYHAGLLAVGRLNARVWDGFDAWRSAGLTVDIRRDGILFTALDPDALDHIRDDLAALQPYGFSAPVTLHGRDLREAEPALRPDIETGVLVESDGHVRPEHLADALHFSLIEHGATFRVGEHVRSMGRSVQRIDRIETDRGTIRGDWFVLAAGAQSSEIAATAGLSLPVISGKGYSVTVTQPETALRRPLYLSDARIACSPYSGANRFAGLMELGVQSATIEPRRALAMIDGASRFLTGWERGASRRLWAGNRALTPDGVPVIGSPMGYDNLVVATGHGMLGVTMATITAQAVADIISDGVSDLDIEALHPDRFRRV